MLPADRIARPVALAWAARGFSCIFWGMAISLLLASGFLSVRAFTHLRIPSHLPGLILILTGAIFLHRSGMGSAYWVDRTNGLTMAAALMIYFTPFLAWWRRMPHEVLYHVNIIALAGVTLWFLVALHRLAEELGRARGNQILRVESRLCLWSSLALYLIPIAIMLIEWLPGAIGSKAAGSDVIPVYFIVWPRWVFAIFSMPFLLTMAVAWEAKEHCLGEAHSSREVTL